MKFLKMFILIFLLISLSNLYAQKKIRRTNNFGSYKDHIYEIGYSARVSYLRYEASLAPYLQLNFSRKMNSILILGFGYASIYDEHFHNNINIETALKFNDRIKVGLKPGITFRNINGQTEWSYSVGFELMSNFKVSDIIYIGPVAEINFLQNDTNYLLGFHMGFTF